MGSTDQHAFSGEPSEFAGDHRESEDCPCKPEVLALCLVCVDKPDAEREACGACENGLVPAGSPYELTSGGLIVVHKGPEDA